MREAEIGNFPYRFASEPLAFRFAHVLLFWRGGGGRHFRWLASATAGDAAERHVHRRVRNPGRAVACLSLKGAECSTVLSSPICLRIFVYFPLLVFEWNLSLLETDFFPGGGR